MAVAPNDIEHFLTALDTIIAADDTYVNDHDLRNGHRKEIRRLVRGGAIQQQGSIGANAIVEEALALGARPEAVYRAVPLTSRKRCVQLTCESRFSNSASRARRVLCNVAGVSRVGMLDPPDTQLLRIERLGRRAGLACHSFKDKCAGPF